MDIGILKTKIWELDVLIATRVLFLLGYFSGEW